MGVVKEILRAGDGHTFPKDGQTVVVHYTGTLPDGHPFDSSRDRNKPFSFQLGAGIVIRGWEEGIAKMSLGERSRLTITPDFAYGASGVRGVIPPDSVLIFDVELLSVQSP